MKKSEKKNQTIINIKNMVCPRCINSVENIFQKMNISVVEIVLGEVLVNITENDIDKVFLEKELQTAGFELIYEKNTKIIEQIKTLIINVIHHSENEYSKIKFSDYLSEKMGKDYNSLSKIFSETEKITIEKYIIQQKTELVKELITYNELNFSDIAFRLNYSSVAHLSKQFKKIAGLTLSEYRKSNDKKRKHLSEI